MTSRLDLAVSSLARLVAADPSLPQGSPTVCWGVVSAVNTGPPASVDVVKNTVTLPAIRYSAALTLTIGDTVRMEVVNSVGFVTDKVA